MKDITRLVAWAGIITGGTSMVKTDYSATCDMIEKPHGKMPKINRPPPPTYPSCAGDQLLYRVPYASW